MPAVWGDVAPSAAPGSGAATPQGDAETASSAIPQGEASAKPAPDQLRDACGGDSAAEAGLLAQRGERRPAGCRCCPPPVLGLQSHL